MDNVKNDLFYLEKLREDLKFIVAHELWNGVFRKFAVEKSETMSRIFEKKDSFVSLKRIITRR